MEEKNKNQLEQIKVVYSLGPTSYTDTFLKSNNFKKFSSIFSSANIKQINAIPRILDNNGSIIFDPNEHLYTRFMSNRKELKTNEGHGTVLTSMDVGQEDATFPRQELWREETQKHFMRAIKRINKIKEERVPVLFLYMVDKRNNKMTSMENLTNISKIKGLAKWVENGFNGTLLTVIIDQREREEQLMHPTERKIGLKSFIITPETGKELESVEKYMKKRFYLDELTTKEELDGRIE